MVHSYPNSKLGKGDKYIWVFVLMYTVMHRFYNPLQSKLRITKGVLPLVWVIFHFVLSKWGDFEYD